MQYDQTCPGIHLLLINQSNDKVAVSYASNPTPYLLPKIGLRPPYYCNPRYELHFPKI